MTRMRPTVIAWLILLALGLSIHAAFRGLGSDYDAEAYSIWFQRISVLTTKEFIQGLTKSNLYYASNILFSFEVGFAVLTFLISRVSSNVEIFFFCMAFLSLGMKSVAIAKYCDRPGWAVLWYVSWYYLLQEMTTVRAGLATGILLLGYGHVRDARYGRFLVYIALACLFHASAFCAIFLIPLRKFKSSVAATLTLLILAFVASYISSLPLINLLGGFFEKINEYYILYTEFGLYEKVNKFNVIILLRVAILLVVGVLAAKSQRMDEKFRFEYSIFAISIISYYALATFPLIGGRVYELLGIFQIFLISSVIASRRNFKLMVSILLLAISLQFYVLVFYVRLADFFYFIGKPYKIETTHKS